MNQEERKKIHKEKEKQRLQREINQKTARQNELLEEIKSLAHSETSSDDPIDTTGIRSQLHFISQEITQLNTRLDEMDSMHHEENPDNVNAVKLNDIVRIHCIYEDGFEEIVIRRLVKSNPNISIDELSIESPLGEAIYHRHQGETVQYTVEKKKENASSTHTAIILEII